MVKVWFLTRKHRFSTFSRRRIGETSMWGRFWAGQVGLCSIAVSGWWVGHRAPPKKLQNERVAVIHPGGQVGFKFKGTVCVYL